MKVSQKVIDRILKYNREFEGLTVETEEAESQLDDIFIGAPFHYSKTFNTWNPLN